MNFKGYKTLKTNIMCQFEFLYFKALRDEGCCEIIPIPQLEIIDVKKYI